MPQDPWYCGNSDEDYLEFPDNPYYAITRRRFDDLNSRTWSIWLFDGRYPGYLDPPVKCGFVQGRGTFLAKDNYQGSPITVRFLWDAQDVSSPRCEQAFSKDDGETWGTN